MNKSYGRLLGLFVTRRLFVERREALIIREGHKAWRDSGHFNLSILGAMQVFAEGDLLTG